VKKYEIDYRRSISLGGDAKMGSKKGQDYFFGYILITTAPITMMLTAAESILTITILSVHLSISPSVCLYVCPTLTLVDQSKMVQARITKPSPLAARKTLVSGTIKLYHKFEGVTLNKGAK